MSVAISDVSWLVKDHSRQFTRLTTRRMALKLRGTRFWEKKNPSLSAFSPKVPIGKKDQAHRDKITHEVQLLSQLNHPNIIRIHAAWEDKNRGMVCFITELMTSGTLRDFITNQSTCVCSHFLSIVICIVQRPFSFAKKIPQLLPKVPQIGKFAGWLPNSLKMVWQWA